MTLSNAILALLKPALIGLLLMPVPQLGAAQDGPVEFSSAPCSSLALGPTDEISHLVRIYLFQGAVQTTQYRFFADAECTMPLYSFVFQGGVELGEPVQGLEDTVNATVTFERVLFTLDSPRGREGAEACGDGEFEVGVQRDVSNMTCLFMRPVDDCGFDYDIVQIKDGIATPGFRTENMCASEGRPTRLQAAGARFSEQF